MPDLLGNQTPQDEERTPDYLGILAPRSFNVQPALPVGGPPAASASAGPTPTSQGVLPPSLQPTQQTGEGGAVSSEPSHASIPDLIQMALSGGLKFSDFARRIFPGEVFGGAVDTPSGQLTTSAPEILRELQFGQTPSQSAFMQQGAAFEPGPVDVPSDPGIGGIAGPAIGGATSVLGLVQAIRSGDPTSIAKAISQAALAGVGIASELSPAVSQAISAVLGESGGALVPGIGIALQWLFAGLDEWTGKNATEKTAAGVERTAEQMPGLTAILQAQPMIAQLATADLSTMSTEDLKNLFTLARAGIQASGAVASPLEIQGRREHGVRFPDYPDAASAVESGSAPALFATLKLQDALASRGVKPGDLPTPATGFWGYPGQDIVGFEGDQGGAIYGGETPGQWSTANSLWMGPDQLLGAIGHWGGFQQPNLVSEGFPSWQQALAAYGGYEGFQSAYERLLGATGGDRPWDRAFLYTPDIMERLYAIEPGGYESGLLSILRDQGDYAGSPLAALEASGGAPIPPSGGNVPAGPAQTAADALGAPSGITGPLAGLSIGGGTDEPFTG